MINSSLVSVCRYAPGMSNLATSRFSRASMAAEISTAYVDAVGDATSSFLMYDCCLLSLSHACPFISSLILSKKMMDALDDASFSFVSLPGSISMKSVVSCSWVSYFVIYYSDFLQISVKIV